MTQSTLYIPSDLDVGYKERNDTYTGKLAYVVYYDEKGVRRKEKSWKGWCSKFIGKMKNEPMSGFVLNRGVGGARQSWGWNARNEYIRVFDPRGWEIEITVANLLFILQECTSVKGKGLEGEFVYSWYGTELVLLPTSCEEYKKSTEYTNIQAKKVTKDQIKEGRMYKFKDTTIGVYLGRHECTDTKFIPSERSTLKKTHVFYIPDTDIYRYEKGFTKLGEVLDDSPEYAEYLETFLNSYRCNAISSIKWEPTVKPASPANCSWGKIGHIKLGDGVYLGRLCEVLDSRTLEYRTRKKEDNYFHRNSHYSGYLIADVLNNSIPSGLLGMAKVNNYREMNEFRYRTEHILTLHHLPNDPDIDKLEFVKPTLILENGKEIDYE